MLTSVKVILVVLVVTSALLITAATTKKTTQPAKPAAKNAKQSKQPAKPSKSAKKPEPKRLPKLVDLGAGKCIPCKAMKPEIESLEKNYKGKLDVVFIDVWENQNAAERYKIRSIPTQIFYDANGKELSRHVGFFSKQDIIARFKEHRIDLKK